MKYTVQVMSAENNSVVKSIECKSEREAYRVADGLEINLDHNNFYVETIETNDSER